MMFDYLQAFREWFKLKIFLWRKQNHVVFKQGDIWWCSVGMNLGEEIFGKGTRYRHNRRLGLQCKTVRERFVQFYSS